MIINKITLVCDMQLCGTTIDTDEISEAIARTVAMDAGWSTTTQADIAMADLCYEHSVNLGVVPKP